MNNNADTVSSELISKIESLTSKLIAEQKENKRMHILNSEKDEDLNSTRKINRELEAKFKVCTNLFLNFFRKALGYI